VSSDTRFDVLVAGGGSAGCVLAARLSEGPAVKVLLVEAGPPDTSDLIHLPAAFSALFRTQHDWDHMTAGSPASTAAACTSRAVARSAGRRR